VPSFLELEDLQMIKVLVSLVKSGLSTILKLFIKESSKVHKLKLLKEFASLESQACKAWE
jgi:hypothetical protein